MTRDEAHNKVIEWIDDLSDKPSTWHYGKIDLHRDIDRIFDSLESRKCENCKYNKEQDNFMIFCDKTMCQDGSKMMWHSFTKDFSCKFWESK